MCGLKIIWPVMLALACFTFAMLIGCENFFTEQTASGAGVGITVSLEDDIAASATAAATIYKDGYPANVTFEAARGYTCQWFVDGKLRGTNASITLDSANYTTGDHFVTLLASKNGVPYSREFIITIIHGYR